MPLVVAVYHIIKSVVLFIYKAHQLAGYATGGTEHPAVVAVRECANRFLGVASRNRKEPLSLDMCMLLVAIYAGPGHSYRTFRLHAL